MKTVTVSSYYEYDPEDFWRLIQKPSTLNFITQGFVSFDWLDPLSEDWIEGVVYRVRFKIFGIIPIGGSSKELLLTIDDEFVEGDPEGNRLTLIYNNFALKKISKCAHCYLHNHVLDKNIDYPNFALNDKKISRYMSHFLF